MERGASPAALLGAVLALAALVVCDPAGVPRAAAAGSARQPLRERQGLVPPGATFLGPAPTTTTLPLVVTLQPREPAALAAEVQAISDPGSPEYRHFLTPAQFGQRFGPTPATIAEVSSALRNEGLTVGSPSPTGLSLPVSGTVAQVQSAFSTPIARYRLSSGRTGYDNRSAPEVPESVAPQIEGILGLDTLSPPQPSTSVSVPQASGADPHAANASATPALAPGQPSPVSGTCTTDISGTETDYGALDADELAQAYSFDPLYSSDHYGAGTTVALVELSGAGYSSSDITHFANCYGITLGNGQITETKLGGGGATGENTVESELDIETVLSLAPKADIEVYEGGESDDLYDMFSRIVSDDTAKIVSTSWTNGCEAYVGQSYQDSENTLFQAAATEGQSIFVATGDQGSEGCNLNGEYSATTGSDPVAQAVDPSTGTLYIADESSDTVSVDSEGSTADPSDFATAGSVPTGSGPDAVALDSSAGKVFVANSGSTLTVFATSTCNQSTTTGCGSPTPVPSGGRLSSPSALAVSGSTLYVGNSNGTVAVYNATSNAWVATITLPSGSTPTALAVDPTYSMVYVADGSKSRIEYFSATSCNATTTSGCGATPATVSVGADPDALAVAAGAGDLYVGNAGSGGGISVVSLSSQTVVTTIATTQPSNGTGEVRSIAMAPDNDQVLAVLDGLEFPGDVLATVDTSTQSISATVSLETGTDVMGQLVSDDTLGYVWVTDESGEGDVVQNLNLAVSDPASQPYVTAVGGTSFGHQTPTLGPPPAESVWNDQLYYSEGAGGGGISATFAMPGYQQSLGTVSGSTGTPCAAATGDCREIPDVSADADPSTGYVVYDSVNEIGPSNDPDWGAIGGTSGATPLWAAVLAVVESADGNTAGYGALNPALYLLAQQSPGTYLNDITSGNNDYNATDGGSFPAMTGYDMATGLGTPVASELASGLTDMPLDVAVSGTQTYGGSPSFAAAANFGGSGSAPYGVTLNSSGLTCTTVDTSTTISSALAVGDYTLATSSCSGLTLSGVNAADYSVVYTSAANDYTVTPGPIDVAVSGTQTYGGAPSFAGNANPPSGITVSTSGLSCTEVGTPPLTIGPSLPAGSATLVGSSCSGATLSGTSADDYTVTYTSAAEDFTVTQAPLTITASSASMTYGSAPPTITPAYSGFVNEDSVSSLSTKPTCSTTATSSSPVSPPTYGSSCSGAVDPNYSIGYIIGTVTVDTAALTITAISGSMTYGGTVPAVMPSYSGFVNGDGPTSLATKSTCSTTATSSSPASPPAYTSSCSGATDSNYTIGYVNGTMTIDPAPLAVTASSGSMTYGGSPPTITPSYSGFVNGDSALSLTTTPTCSTAATSSSSVAGGPYASFCSGAMDPNYTMGYITGSVAVGQAPLTVTASSPTMTYGSTPPAITPQYAGFVNGDSSASLTTKPTCTTAAKSSSPVSVSPYASSCSGAVDSNYTIGYVAGSVAVTPAPLTITASSQTMTYGSSPPAVTPEYSGFKNGDSASSLTTQPTCSTTATNSSSVSGSPYSSSCSGAADPNYTIGYVAGSTTVTPAPIPVAVSGSQTNGGAPSFTGTDSPPSGVSVDTAGVTCSELTPSTPVTSTLAAGSYTLRAASCSGASLSGADASDYVVAYTSASNDFTVTNPPSPPTPPPPTPTPTPTHGYWLVGSDGGIFNFGSANFYGSTGSLKLQRPVVGIVPTKDDGGYWLDASDGGVFSYGDTQFYGSIPGLGLHPAGSGLPDSLNAPIVGMVPSSDDGGYFMVASDGGVFAFGDAHFAGSCPGIGGCSGAAVAVMPDASGNGYWLVTQTGSVYTFGDAPNYGEPGHGTVTSAVATPDGKGYWILLSNGEVFAYGDAANLGSPAASNFNALDAATAIFATSDGGGYWVSSALGAVFNYGDAPSDGGMSGTHLNGSIIAATGF